MTCWGVGVGVGGSIALNKMTLRLQNWYIFYDKTVFISLFYEQVLYEHGLEERVQSAVIIITNTVVGASGEQLYSLDPARQVNGLWVRTDSEDYFLPISFDLEYPQDADFELEVYTLVEYMNSRVAAIHDR